VFLSEKSILHLSHRALPGLSVVPAVNSFASLSVAFDKGLET